MLVGIDVGGTFTDFYLADGRTHKVFTTPGDPSRGVLQGLRELGLDSGQIVHGSTIATNAFLERKGARVVLLITRGFRDLVEIGRQTRDRLYDLDWTRPAPLYSAVVEVDERLAADGSVLRPLRLPKIPRSEAYAVCLLHSYRNPKHELALERAIRSGHVSRSSDVVSEYREYERFATTVLNAYVAPVMQRYLENLGARLPQFQLRVMASSGGSVTVPAACRRPVVTLLSGPSAGVVATEALMQRLDEHRAISFDMGGTSTDVALIDGRARLTREGRLAGYPVRVPMIEIHTVGAGGGSIAWFDEGGVLRVGPRSQGAHPGPACYGRGGTLPTVTDANVVLGRIHPDRFLGGRFRLDPAQARKAVGDLAGPILEVVNSNMERAIRFISVERGYDPSEFALVAFGGAGPLHACELARSLRMRRVIVPPRPGNFCALGALMADIVKEKSRTILGGPPKFEDLERACLRELRAEGCDVRGAVVRRMVEMRYRGQSHELTLDWGRDVERRFHEAHRRRYGFAMPDKPVEIVNAAVRVTLRVRKPSWPRVARRRGRFTGHVERSDLGWGSVVAGPAVISEDNATTWVPSGFEGEVDRYGCLHLWET